MPLKERHADLRDTPVFVRQWPATRALEMLSHLLDAFGEAIPAMASGDWDNTEAIRVIFQLKNDVAYTTLRDTVSSALIDGREVTPHSFSQTFDGDLYLVVEVFALVCEVNYKDFFEQGQSRDKEREKALSEKKEKESK